MLQQTRVETVRRYYDRFLARFPDVLCLAEAHADEVFALWSGLGYYRRARLLHEGAKAIAALGGLLPKDRSSLRAVPGIGRYTAGAVASIAFGEAVGLVDGNVARVLARLFGIDEDMRRAGMKRAESLADRIVSKSHPGEWNQALMELGATVCSPRSPRCEHCPVADLCCARREDRVAELPKLSARAKPTEARFQAFVVRRGDAVLLGRRDGRGTFAGLWEPPCAAGGKRAARALTDHLSLSCVESRGRVVHVLSHRRLTVDVFRAARDPALPLAGEPPRGYDALGFVAEDELDTLGVSALARKVLASAG